jgi:hypothetical protein
MSILAVGETTAVLKAVKCYTRTQSVTILETPYAGVVAVP